MTGRPARRASPAPPALAGADLMAWSAACLAELSDAEVRRLITLARARRRRSDQERRDLALRQARADLLAGASVKAAAEEIAAAAARHRGIAADSPAARERAALRPLLRLRLQQTLGDLRAVPGVRRLRQILREP